VALFLDLLVVDTFNRDKGVGLGRIDIEASHIGDFGDSWNSKFDDRLCELKLLD
jgi:hypothetical protein